MKPVLPNTNVTGVNEWSDVESDLLALVDVFENLGDDNIAAAAAIAQSKIAGLVALRELVEGELGDVNIAADAAIQLSKLEGGPELVDALAAAIADLGANVATLDEPGGHLLESQLPPSVVSGKAVPSRKGQILYAPTIGDNEGEWRTASVFDIRDYGPGMLPEVEEDLSTKINAFLAELPRGSKVHFPNANPAGAVPPGLSRYYVGKGIHIPVDIEIEGPNMGRVVFSALPGFEGHQVVKNWADSDGTSFNPPNSIAVRNYYPHIKNIGIDLNGQSNLTCLGLAGIQERTILRDIVLFSNASGGPDGEGNYGLAIFAIDEANGQCAGRWITDHIVGYGGGWANFIHLDGTNGGTTEKWIRDPNLTNITTPTGPADGSICSDSPIFARACDYLQIDGHCEAMPPSVSADTAIVRTIDCSRTSIRMRLSPGGYTVNRPAVKATQTGAALPYMPMTSPQLEAVNIFKENAKGWTSRTDEGCKTTSGSPTVENSHAEAGDRYLPVYGPGIPSGTYVSEVVAGEKWVLSANAFRTGTFTLTRSANIIEDRMGGKTRDWTYDSTYFDPRQIYDYTGSKIDWANGGGSSPTRRHGERRSAAGMALVDEDGLVAANYQRPFNMNGAGQPVLESGKLFVTPVLLFPGDVVSEIRAAIAGTEGKELTHSWAALFGPKGELLGISADEGTKNWTASSDKKLALESPATARFLGPHYLGLCVVGTTMPNLQSCSIGVLQNRATVRNGVAATGLTAPSGCPTVLGAITPSNNAPCVAVF